MNVDSFRVPLRSPFAAIVFKIANKLLFLCVARNDRLMGFKERLGLAIDILKLGVSINVLSAFLGFSVCLETIVHATQKLPNSRRRNLVAPFAQLIHKIT